MDGEGTIEIVHATPQAAYVDPVADIESVQGIQLNHAPGCPNSSDDSISDGNVLRT